MALNEVAVRLAAFYQKLEEEKLGKERFYIQARLREKIEKIQMTITPLTQEEVKSEKERQCLVEIHAALKRLTDLTKKLEEKFSIFIVGDGNVGKSTVVNSLIGQTAAKMKFDPMTWKIDVFYKGNSDEVQLVYHDKKGNRAAVFSKAHAQGLIDEEEARRDESIKKIQHSIKEKTALLDKVCKAQHIPYREVAEKLEAYKERVWQEEIYTSSIVEARWPVETNELLENFQVVDTPGLRQNRMASALEESVKKYYDEADGIIWVLDMNKIAMDSTKTYIEEIEAKLFTKGKARDQKRMLALLNRSDCIRSEAEKEVILAQAKNMYQDYFNEILPYSANLALEGRLSGDPVLLEKSGYQRLEEYIRKYFLQGANEVKTEKTLKEIQKEEIKFQVLVSYYIEEIEGRTKAHIAGNNKLQRSFEILEKESVSQFENIITSYYHMTAAAIDKIPDELLMKRETRLERLQKEIFKLGSYQTEIKDFIKSVVKKIEALKGEYLGKPLLRKAKEEPLEKFRKHMDLSPYFAFLEEEEEPTKIEVGPIKKLMSGFHTVKKLVDKPYIEEQKKQLLQGLEMNVEQMNRHLIETLKESLLKEKRQILYLRQQDLNEKYGDDTKRIKKLYALKTVEKILLQPTRESTIIDYIREVGDKENGAIH